MSRSGLLTGTSILLWSLLGSAQTMQIRLSNELGIARQAETVSLPWRDLLQRLPRLSADHVWIVDSEGGVRDIQIVDADQDGHPEELLFQADLGGWQTVTYLLSVRPGPRPVPVSRAYGRYVPERLDDFAWESDRIAFRAYGQALMTDPQEKLTSSGIDVWVKRVSYLVVDKWYASGAYHQDHGEGLDCYSVGKSRGCGGGGIWRGGVLYSSENWLTHRILANGPIRVSFELTYASWDAAGQRVSERKRVTLDAGSNLNRVESIFVSEDGREIPVAVGIADHNNKGATFQDLQQGVLAFWEATPNAQNGTIGCGVVMPHGAREVLDAAGHHLVTALAESGRPLTYYAGAGWDRSGQFGSLLDWQTYLTRFAQRLRSPLQVTLPEPLPPSPPHIQADRPNN